MKTVKPGTYIDVVGVVVNMGSVGTVPGSNQATVARKNVVIADDSMFTIIIGFWGDDAVKLDLTPGSTILAIKNA